LDRALSDRYADATGANQRAYLLDVQVVDAADVANRRGYGALLTSLHHPPIKVWER
jgi:hypothetical protein